MDIHCGCTGFPGYSSFWPSECFFWPEKNPYENAKNGVFEAISAFFCMFQAASKSEFPFSFG